MRGWHRPTRVAIGLFIIVFGATVFFAVRERAPVEDPSLNEQLEPDAVMESTEAVVTQAKGDVRDMTVEAERQLTYEDGSTRLVTVRVAVERGEADRNFVITGKEAVIGQDNKTIELFGEVHLETVDGLEIDTEQAHYDEAENLLRMDGPVTFSRGRLSGSSVGGIYNEERALLRLLSQARVVMAMGPGGNVDATSDTASMSQNEDWILFERNVRIDQEGQLTAAETVLAYFDETTSTLKQVELRGGGSITSKVGHSAKFEEMQAQEIDLLYGDPGGVLRYASLRENASIRMKGEARETGQRVSGQLIDVSFGPGGDLLTNLDVQGGVYVELPTDTQRPAQRILAGVMSTVGNEEEGLTEAAFTNDVEYREVTREGLVESRVDRVIRSTRLETNLREGIGIIENARFIGNVVFEDLAVDRVVASDTLETMLTGGSEGLQTAQFAGNVRFRDGTTEAVSETAIYAVSAGMITLQQAEASGRPARVVDTRSSVEAATIDLLMNGAGLKASGGVTSILTASENESEGAGTEAKMPGLVSSDDPVYVTSDELLYDGKTGLALYTGHARLWQGETTVQADSIELDERTADLKASGAARSTFILEEINPETDELEAATTVASAQGMHYEEEFRRTTYTDTAHVNGPYGDLTAAKVEMYMGEKRGSMDRAEAYETVKLLLNRRIATGGRLTYFTDSGRYVMHGTPVQILEDMITECRETLGQTLTFFRAIETITVDGNGEVRTQTTRTEMCPEPQFN